MVMNTLRGVWDFEFKIQNFKIRKRLMTMRVTCTFRMPADIIICSSAVRSSTYNKAALALH
jgi:hypothetical protein